jgi:uncharacterized RDD family membrane protein YckC
MQGVMNAMAQTSASALSGSKLDNRRMLAALIDLAIVGAGGAAILLAAGVLGGDGTALSAPLIAVVVGWGLYYWFACETGGGQSVGKKLTRVRVVRVDGRPADMREIGIRTVLRVIDFALVGLIAMLATGERRARLGDLAAGTMVVAADGAAAPASVAAPAVAAPAEAPAVEAGEDTADEAEEEPVAEYEPITGEEPAPDIATPTLKELAEDVAAAAGTAPDVEPEPEPAPLADLEPRPVAEVEIGGPEIDVDSPDVTVRSVETVSAIDLVMGGDEPPEDRPAADPPPAGA